MATTQEIEETAEDEVVADEAVALSRSLRNVRKRHLKLLEEGFQTKRKHLVDVQPQAPPPTESEPDRQKLLLHRSVSRYRPPQHQLHKWVAHAMSGALLLLEAGCIIMLRQPRTKRPGRSFHNPTRPRPHPTRYNDSISFGAIVLLANNSRPAHEYDEASHLCGHGRCIEPTHLVWEDMGTNVGRNLCHLYNVACTHNPPCIQQSPGDRALIKQHLIIKE